MGGQECLAASKPSGEVSEFCQGDRGNGNWDLSHRRELWDSEIPEAADLIQLPEAVKLYGEKDTNV